MNESEDIAQTINELLDAGIGLSVLLMMFSMGLAMTFGQAFSIWRQPRKLVVSLLAALVAAPVITYVLVTIFDGVPEEVEVGLLLVAAAGGSGLVPKVAEKIGADITATTSTLVTLALMTILSAPIVVQFAIDADAVDISTADVAGTVVSAIVAPILLGVAIRQWWTRLAELITATLTNISDKLVIVIVLVIILRDFDTMLDFGLGPVLLLFATAALLTGLGHLVGGPEPVSRIELGLFTSQRNGAVALLIATEAMPAAASAVVAYGVAALVIAVTYVSTVGGTLSKESAAPAEQAT
jgi:BASS family bile acid:Na+ symporter